MDKRILIPTDFSDNALNAARYALDLYANQDCEFYFLHVFHPRSYTTGNLFFPEEGSGPYEAAKAKSDEGLEKFTSLLKLEGGNFGKTFYTLSVQDYLSEAMKRTIAKNDIDLVVMGTKGSSGSKGVIFGSNTVQAMEEIRDCPILAVPEDYLFSPLKEIVFPTDFRTDFKRRVLQGLLEIANMNNTAIRVLHVSRKDDRLNPGQEENKQLLDEILEATTHSFHTITDKDVSEGIASFVQSRESDMIAFINRKHFFFGSVFSKPLVKEIGYDATTPILALH